MPIQFVREDITQIKADAIVNAANTSLLGGGGVDGAIHAAAGPELLEECRTLGGCQPGCAKLTGAYRLPCKYVIHTVGPVWRGGGCGEREILASCYRTSLELAWGKNCETVAFPLISSGAYGYPMDQALQVAVETVGRFLQDHDMSVYIVIFNRAPRCIGTELFAKLDDYIDRHYVDAQPGSGEQPKRWRGARALARDVLPSPAMPAPMMGTQPLTDATDQALPSLAGALGLKEALRRMDEGFAQTLLRLIDERGMTDAQCYKKANIDRKLFSKIRSNPAYRPSKPTALAFAVALELSLEETEELLKRAGFALSRSSKFDVIVEYFISQGCYDVFTINEALFAFDQSLLGG